MERKMMSLPEAANAAPYFLTAILSAAFVVLYVSAKKGMLIAAVMDPISVVMNATRLAVPLFNKGVKMRAIRKGAMALISNSS